ncbi:hypothetical protein C8R43DRAFT_1123402 [Mycena crocata]|nr:hypothetical protein C8R43DRAFT_1123402 [Mycena crocata]
MSMNANNLHASEIWFLSVTGSITRDPHHAFYFQDEHQEKPAADKTMADCVVFSARSFETITEFLPHCIGFEKTFVRDKHSNRQVGKLFYVVDGASDIFVTKEDAKAMYDKLNNSAAGIMVYTDVEKAKLRGNISYGL